MLSFMNNSIVGPVVVIEQFSKMKIFRGLMGISNTKFSSRLFINAGLLEVMEFKFRIHSGESSSTHSLSQL
ncbi:hypothetical protein QYF36_014805 [Acer negundo]|nr:hypothetical protein QYF36_014805 [Acer negundo]